MNFTPGYIPPSNSLAPEISAFGAMVHNVVCEVGKAYSIAESGDRAIHAAELSSRLIRLAPTCLSAFIMALAAGDDEAARQAVADGLTVLVDLDPNAVTINGCNSKQLHRILGRCHYGDRASSDASVDYSGLTESRLAAYQLAGVLGIVVEADLIKQAMDLDAAIRQAKIDREEQARLDSEARVRRKSTDPSAKPANVFGGYR